MKIAASYNPRSRHFTASLFLLFTYSLGVFSEGAWSDDYPAFVNPSSAAMHAVRDARPVHGVFIEFLFGQVNSVSDLAYIRAFGLLGLILLNSLVIHFLAKANNSIFIPIISTFSFTLPSFQLSAHWAIAFHLSWSAVFSTLGLVLFRKKFFTQKLLGLLLCSMSLLTYPLMTFFVFSLLFAEYLANNFDIKSILINTKEVFTYLISGGFLSIFFVFLLFTYQDLEPNPRVGLVAPSEIILKLYFFLTRPFGLSFTPFKINSPGVFEMILSFLCMLVTILMLLFVNLKTMKGVFKNFLMLSIYTTLSIFPLIIVRESQIDLRFIGSSTWLILFSTTYLFFKTLHKYCNEIRFKIVFNCLVVLMAAFSFVSINNRYIEIISPIYRQSSAFISSQLRDCSEEQLKNGIQILKRNKEWPDRKLLGFYSQYTDLASSWVPVGAVALNLKKQLLSTKSIEYSDSLVFDSSFCQVFLDKF